MGEYCKRYRSNKKDLQKEAFGLTSPLITLASGAKMGKLKKVLFGLNEDQFSAYDYWQFWRNTDDRDVKDFLIFLLIEPKEIENIFNVEKNINNLKILLANEATKILHGEELSKKAEQTAKDTFGGNGLGSELPEIFVKIDEIKKGINFFDFIKKIKFFHLRVRLEELFLTKVLRSIILQ